MRPVPRGTAIVAVTLMVTAWPMAAPNPAGAAGSPSPAPKLTGAYELYCPATVLGDVVINAITVATLSPAHPKPEQKFYLKGLQERVTFAAGLAQGLATLSPLSGSAALVLHLGGARPATAKSQDFHFTVTIPRTVASSGLKFGVPTAPASMGPFTATGADVVISQDKRQVLSLALGAGGQEKVALTCTSFPPGTAATKPGTPWSGAGQPPLSKAISPVIAFG